MKHMKLSSLLVVLLFSAAAHATSTPNPSGGQGGNGGAGGQGGAGGSSQAIAGANAGASSNAGAAVVGSGNSRNTNRNSNRNSNSNLNAQGQQQSANNRQKQTATGGKSSARGGNATGGNSTGGSATGGAGGQANQSMDGANQQNVDASSSYRAAVSTAYAPAIYPTAPCMGSSAIGGQGMSFGFSLGSAWKDEDCNFREDIRTVAVVLGDVQTAEEMECQKAAYREARARMNRPCRDARASTAPVASVTHEPVEYTDPFVRRRLGLAPL
jgi:hypothetical protein